MTDFERNFDQIDLRSFGFDDFFEDVLSRASGTANDTKIEFGQGDVLYIENLPISELDSSLVIL